MQRSPLASLPEANKRYQAASKSLKSSLPFQQALTKMYANQQNPQETLEAGQNNLTKANALDPTPPKQEQCRRMPKGFYCDKPVVKDCMKTIPIKVVLISVQMPVKAQTN